MPEPPSTPTPTGLGSTFDIHATYCRTCRQPLNMYVHKGSGVVEYLHAVELRGGAVDHLADPAPLTEIDQPVMECDFCSRPEAVWAYVCAEQDTQRRVVTSRVVDARDYRDRHHAARARQVRTAEAPTHAWGRHWSTCSGCAELIEARDLLGLISRVTDSLPAKYTRGKNLARTRAELHAAYSTFLATLAPGRGRITPQAPLGQWPESPPTP